MNVEHVDGFVPITAASRALDVSADTIRRWNKLGLIKTTRDKNNNRLFNLAEIERLQKKLAGDECGTKFEVLESGKLFEEASCVDLFAGGGS